MCTVTWNIAVGKEQFFMSIQPLNESFIGQASAKHSYQKS